MAKLNTKREKGRGWTASTFLPEGGSHSIDMSTNLDAISENAMDEDLLDTDNTAHAALLQAASTHLIVPTADNNGGNSSGDGSHSDESAESDSGEEDDAENNTGDNGEDGGEEDSNQDQGASDDSDDDTNSTTDKEGRAQGAGGSKERSSRSRAGVVPRKKRPSIGSLSTSPSNLTRIVSATPSKKIAKKSKKTIKPKGSKGNLSSAAARQATEEAKLETAKPIVTRFLEMDNNTKLNDKLLQVFMVNGKN